MTTHTSAFSVARDVVRTGRIPVLVYRPTGVADRPHDAVHVTTVKLPLDGTRASETMQVEAAEWVRALTATLLLAQVLPANARHDPLLVSSDILEDSYDRDGNPWPTYPPGGRSRERHLRVVAPDGRTDHRAGAGEDNHLVSRLSRRGDLAQPVLKRGPRQHRAVDSRWV